MLTFFRSDNGISFHLGVTVEFSHLTSSKGRGVWESNPPGTAPSDPPAVLKTVRPTGAPTPPYVWVYFAIRESTCQAWLCVLSKLLDALYIYFCQIFYH